MKLPDEKVLELFRARLDGVSIQKCADRFGIHFMYAQAVLKGEARTAAFPDHPDRAACVAAERSRREAYRERRRHLTARGGAYDRAVADYRQGYSLRAAAARHGFHWVMLKDEMCRRGIPRRPDHVRSPLGPKPKPKPVRRGRIGWEDVLRLLPDTAERAFPVDYLSFVVRQAARGKIGGHESRLWKLLRARIGSGVGVVGRGVRSDPYRFYASSEPGPALPVRPYRSRAAAG